MKRVPTDAEIDRVAVRLGIDEDGTCPRRLRAKVAKTILLAEQDTATVAQASLTGAVDAVIAAYKQMRAADIGPAEAAAMTAALAPQIFRTAPPERNRTHAK